MKTLLIALGLMMLTGCATFGSGIPADKPMDNERTVSSNSILWMIMFGWPTYKRGSGVQIDKNWIVTAQHVEGLISGWEDNPKCDIALIHSPSDEFVKQDPIADVPIGGDVVVRGKPIFRGWYATPGKVTGYMKSLGKYKDCRVVMTSANAIPGQSGGGVYDTHGNLLGITTQYGEDGKSSGYVSLIYKPIREWVESVIGHKLEIAK